MSQVESSLSIANPHPDNINCSQKIALALSSLGVLLLFVAFLGGNINQTNYQFLLLPSFLCISLGSIGYTYATYHNTPAGIKNNGVFGNSLTNKGAAAWFLGIFLTGFYVLLYWFPQYLGLGAEGAGNSGLIQMFDGLSYLLNGKAATQWFVYGTLYTLIILILGIKFIVKYRHNRYQQIRTLSVIFFQTAFAFLLPEFLSKMNSDLPYFSKDMKNMWPLNYYFFEEWHLNNMLQGGNLGMFMLLLGVAMIFIISPILTYFYGKRWYCSWVCGCGGLAETAGDAFRHLSDKSLKAWQAERIIIYSILLFILLTTAMLLYTFFTGNSQVWIFNTYELKKWYGFFIGAMFSGVVGVGFYPILGSRVWCRFGCPMAAILGLQQRFFSRFRITTNGAQCISCGNCSTYCEMGIDVRWYAQRGQDIVRSSCVGCGVCSAVCPRGVLKLENGPVNSRKIIDISEDGGIRVNV